LIIMDVQMPGMNGLEASRAIQQLEHASTGQVVPIIALTASVLDKDRQEARDACMAGFATKPLNIPALVNEMARLLNRQNTALSTAGQGDTKSPVIDWQRGLALWGDQPTLSR